MKGLDNIKVEKVEVSSPTTKRIPIGEVILSKKLYHRGFRYNVDDKDQRISRHLIINVNGEDYYKGIVGKVAKDSYIVVTENGTVIGKVNFKDVK